MDPPHRNKSRTFRGLRLAVLLVFTFIGAGTPSKQQNTGAIGIGPARAYEVHGVSVTLKERFDGALGRRRPRERRFLLVPGPLPLPGSGEPILGAAPRESSPEGELSLQEPLGIDRPPTGEPVPDTHGAAGPYHLASILNRDFVVFNKTSGAVISGPISLQAFWARLGTGPGQSAENPFDPKVLHEQYSGRFIVVMDGGGGPGLPLSTKRVQVDDTRTCGMQAVAIDVERL